MRLHVKMSSTNPNSSGLYQTKKGGLGQLRKVSNNSVCQNISVKLGEKRERFKK